MKKIILPVLLIVLLSGCAVYRNQQYVEYERQIQLAHTQGQMSDLEYSQRMYELQKDKQLDLERRRQASQAIGNAFQNQQYLQNQQRQTELQQQQTNMQTWQGYMPAPMAAAGYTPTPDDKR